GPPGSAEGAADQELLVVGQPVVLLVPRTSCPRAVALELPRGHLGGECQLEHLAQAFAGILVLDLDQRLDATVEVAQHDVGAPDPDGVLTGRAEMHDPRVLEEPAENASDADGL